MTDSAAADTDEKQRLKARELNELIRYTMWAVFTVTDRDFARDEAASELTDVLDQANGNIILCKHGGNPKITPWSSVILQAQRINLQNAISYDIDGDGVDELIYTWEGDDDGFGGQGAVRILKTDFVVEFEREAGLKENDPRRPILDGRVFFQALPSPSWNTHQNRDAHRNGIREQLNQSPQCGLFTRASFSIR